MEWNLRGAPSCRSRQADTERARHQLELVVVVYVTRVHYPVAWWLLGCEIKPLLEVILQEGLCSVS